MIFNKKDFEHLILRLKPEGFLYKGDFGSAKFIKEEDSRTIVIGIGYNQYFPHSAVIKGISAEIYFEKVESILDQVYEKLKIKNRFGQTSTVHKSFVNLPEVDYSTFEIEIKDEASFQKVVAQVRKVIIGGAIPFFEQFSTLQKVFDYSESISIEEMSNFIGQPLPQRRMIIKKLCGDTGYKAYAQMVIDFYANENDPDVPIVRELDNFLETI